MQIRPDGVNHSGPNYSNYPSPFPLLPLVPLGLSHSFPSFHPRFSPIFLTALSKAYPFERLSNGSLKNLEFQNQRAPPVVRIVE